MIGADPALLSDWVAGWAASRGVGPPRREGQGHYVEVGLPTQRARYVFPTIDHDELRERAEAIHEPWIFLKICLPPAMLAEAWPGRWVVQPATTMMAARLEAVERKASLASGYALAMEEDGAALVASIRSGDELAAQGRLILSGAHAVFDRIVTDEAHRRRGLAGCVMATLTEAALERDIRTGALVATAAGRQLYEAIGWSWHADYTTAVIPGAESPVI